MNYKKILANININGYKTLIKADNMVEHRIFKNTKELIDIILSLGIDKLIEIQEAKDEVIIINKDRNIVIILAGNTQEIEIIDIIDDASIFVNDGISMKEF